MRVRMHIAHLFTAKSVVRVFRHARLALHIHQEQVLDGHLQDLQVQLHYHQRAFLLPNFLCDGCSVSSPLSLPKDTLLLWEAMDTLPLS